MIVTITIMCASAQMVRKVGRLESKAEATLDNYEANLRIVRILGEGYGFRVFCFWQPASIYGHKPLHTFEMRMPSNDATKPSFHILSTVYRLAERRAAKDHAFVFLGDIFDSITERLYLDWMHLAPQGNELVARSLAKAVEDGLKSPQLIEVGSASEVSALNRMSAKTKAQVLVEGSRRALAIQHGLHIWKSRAYDSSPLICILPLRILGPDNHQRAKRFSIRTSYNGFGNSYSQSAQDLQLCSTRGSRAKGPLRLGQARQGLEATGRRGSKVSDHSLGRHRSRRCTRPNFRSPRPQWGGKVDHRRHSDHSRSPNPGIWKMLLNGGQESRVLDQPSGNEWFNWALTGKGIYFLNHAELPPTTVNFFESATQKTAHIATLDKPTGWGLALAPDGRSLLYVEAEFEESKSTNNEEPTGNSSQSSGRIPNPNRAELSRNSLRLASHSLLQC
jgi:nucleotide-binding universal stress UspA family protein